MRTGIALAGVAVLAVGGVLAAGMLAAATATADPCPTPAPAAAAGPAPGALALRAGQPALTAAARSPAAAPTTGGVGGPVPPVVGTGPVCQPATAAATGPTPGAGGADAAFDPGNIASDEVFYNTTAMTLQQITAFIDEQNAGCEGPWCLRNLTLDTTSEPADAYCQAYTGGPAQTAAKMLYDFSRACGINPQVMLVTLQKESQGLTRTDPTESSYAAAWGWHCPDTGPGGSANCDPQYAGFFHQGYGMAHQWAKYRVEIPNGQYNYQPGRTYDIAWNVAESGCGAGPVSIRNLATASLYVYTPYQPNAASLAAYPGEGYMLILLCSLTIRPTVRKLRCRGRSPALRVLNKIDLLPFVPKNMVERWHVGTSAITAQASANWSRRSAEPWCRRRPPPAPLYRLLRISCNDSPLCAPPSSVATQPRLSPACGRCSRPSHCSAPALLSTLFARNVCA